jgi:cellulose synthase/poly-beta-1,6-N-acetylglucosamine synthase-like glycosyltransferase
MSSSQLETKGFFSGLFDFGFTSFITLRFLKVIYTILVVLILLTGVVFFIGAISQGGFGVVVAIVFVPIATLLYLVIARVYMELVALFFRIGENTSIMARALSGAPAPAAGYQQPPTAYGGAADPFAGPPTSGV